MNVIYASFSTTWACKSKAIKKCRERNACIFAPSPRAEKILPIVPLNGWKRKVLTSGWGMSPFSLIDQMEKRESLLPSIFWEGKNANWQRSDWGAIGVREMFGGIFLFYSRNRLEWREICFGLKNPKNEMNRKFGGDVKDEETTRCEIDSVVWRMRAITELCGPRRRGVWKFQGNFYRATLSLSH